MRDATFRDYSCLILEDCTAEPIGAGFARTNHEASLLVIETLFGWISNSQAVLGALARQAHPSERAATYRPGQRSISRSSGSTKPSLAYSRCMSRVCRMNFVFAIDGWSTAQRTSSSPKPRPRASSST